MYYCTHSDKNYLAKGITLVKNILSHDENALIFYLCLDDETYNTVKELDNVEAIRIRKLEQNYPELLAYKQLNHKSNYGDAHSQYCWALTPFLIWHLLHSSFAMFYEVKEIIYCDADLYFYDSPIKIAESCKNKSVGIHSHGFSSYDPQTNDVGEFNVGCLYFKNNPIGQKVSTTWKNWLLNPQNEYAQKYGTCGDQKYLDLFIPLFGAENICVFDREANILHAAPWNVTNYDYSKPVDLLFYHFSHFNTDFNGNWRSSNHGEWMPERDIPYIKYLYEQYNNQVTKSNELINK